MAVIYISETEATRDFAALLTRAGAGEEDRHANSGEGQDNSSRPSATGTSPRPISLLWLRTGVC
jgi:hypothetical protein